ncbi:hypothetical protein QF047_002372 [Arthrobacter sp. W4I7]|nr:hypothetical protein [Arthrobacter sp. W4I7]
MRALAKSVGLTVIGKTSRYASSSSREKAHAFSLLEGHLVKALLASSAWSTVRT